MDFWETGELAQTPWTLYYSGFLKHAPFKDFFPTAKCVFGGCQSSVSMAIQERALNEKQSGSKFSAE